MRRGWSSRGVAAGAVWSSVARAAEGVGQSKRLEKITLLLFNYSRPYKTSVLFVFAALAYRCKASWKLKHGNISRPLFHSLCGTMQGKRIASWTDSKEFLIPRAFVLYLKKIKVSKLVIFKSVRLAKTLSTRKLAIHCACMHNLLMRELCSLHHYSLLPAVCGAVCQVSCLPTLNLGASDEWDCHSQGHLAAHWWPSLSWSLHGVALLVSRDVLICSSTETLYSLDLCPTFVQ